MEEDLGQLWTSLTGSVRIERNTENHWSFLKHQRPVHGQLCLSHWPWKSNSLAQGEFLCFLRMHCRGDTDLHQDRAEGDGESAESPVHGDRSLLLSFIFKYQQGANVSAVLFCSTFYGFNVAWPDYHNLWRLYPFLQPRFSESLKFFHWVCSFPVSVSCRVNPPQIQGDGNRPSPAPRLSVPLSLLIYRVSMNHQMLCCLLPIVPALAPFLLRISPLLLGCHSCPRGGGLPILYLFLPPASAFLSLHHNLPMSWGH